MRDAERDLIFNEYKDRKGELIRGIVRRFEKGNNIIVDLGKTEGVLPFREQTPRETYRPGDRIVAYVKDIDREARGPQIILSRSDPRARREALRGRGPRDLRGHRADRRRAPASRARARKIAVTSRDADVDPVGACVGMKGSRVQAVVQELRGEKIDIVPFDRDPARYVIAAIQPAEVHKVIVDEADGRMELVVPDEKLSLAIGRKGQNVRLAAQLTGWKLDIISESKFKQMEEEAIARPRSRSTASTETIAQGDVPPRLPRPRRGRRGQRSRSSRAHPRASAAPRTPRKHQGAAPRRRWSASVRSASQAAELADRAAHRRERLLFVRGVGERTIAAPRRGGLPERRGRPARGRGQARHPTGLGIKKARAIKQGAQLLRRERAEASRERARRGARPRRPCRRGRRPTIDTARVPGTWMRPGRRTLTLDDSDDRSSAARRRRAHRRGGLEPPGAHLCGLRASRRLRRR